MNRMKVPIGAVRSKILTIGIDPLDREEVRLQKQIFAAGLFLIILACTFWGATYAYFGEVTAALISLGYAVFTILSLLVIQRWRRLEIFLPVHLSAGLLLPFFQTLLLGGFGASGAVFLWSLLSPLAALFFYRMERAFIWALAYFVLLTAAVMVQPQLDPNNLLPSWLVTIFFGMNIVGVSLIVLSILNYFLEQKNEAYRLLAIEEEKAENLLLNILPEEIAAILKNESRTIAENFMRASILFADLVGFTPLTAKMAPIEMVNLLNLIFSYFDDLVEKYGLEKIRTIGDSYMVAAGVPRPRADHAQALAYLALDMQAYICSLPPVDGRAIQFRIGINSGPVVGGVIGRKKFVYDIWGDAVNIASRMESQGEAGRVQITQATHELIKSEFLCEWRGTIEIKGRGAMGTWFLIGVRQPSTEAKTMERHGT